MEQLLYTPEEAAEVLKVSRSTVYDLPRVVHRLDRRLSIGWTAVKRCCTDADRGSATVLMILMCLGSSSAGTDTGHSESYLDTAPFRSQSPWDRFRRRHCGPESPASIR